VLYLCIKNCLNELTRDFLHCSFPCSDPDYARHEMFDIADRNALCRANGRAAITLLEIGQCDQLGCLLDRRKPE